MVEDCTSFSYVQSGDGCYDIAANNGIALDELYTWNPALNGDCSGLWPDYYICVGVGTTTTTATTTTGAVETPTPTQAGMLSSCKSFYYVQSGDGCYDIAAENGVTLDNLYSSNPALNEDCSGGMNILHVGYTYMAT
jgi:LysM repeat protein